MMLGAGGRSQNELAEALQTIGGSLRVDDGADGMAISGDALRSGFGDLLGLLSDVLTDPAYPKSAVEREAGRLRDHVRRALSQPGVIADEAWLQRRYGDHVYGRNIPSPEEISAVSPGPQGTHRRRMLPARQPPRGRR